ncbi:MAG: glycosyltransferase family 2 protein [Chitinophagaceae bacterium]
MKVSICIPQYNRIQFLLLSLERIANQTYENIEISISDDCSTDDTEAKIKNLQQYYRFPIIYSRNQVNCGYDRNYRKSIEIATGDYCMLIGNDDTLYDSNTVAYLVDFLQKNNLPEIGFCNYVEHNNPGVVIARAAQTGVLGTGNDVAMKNYSNFSFVGGIIYNRPAFLKYNTGKFDGSVFAQMYLGVLMVAGGNRLFSIKEPMVLKDLRIEGKMSNSYRDTLARNWKDYKVVNAGLPSVMNVLINGFRDAGTLNQQMTYRIFKKIYTITFPFWILDYKSNKAFPEAIGLIAGLHPLKNENFKSLSLANRIRIYSFYIVCSSLSIVTPVTFFNKFKTKIYNYLKR